MARCVFLTRHAHHTGWLASLYLGAFCGTSIVV
eukprot:COSAG01_NODE_36634_length_514_cov_2.240964_1_plen_32_part_10